MFLLYCNDKCLYLPVKVTQHAQRIKKRKPMRVLRSYILQGIRYQNGMRFVDWEEFFRTWNRWC